MWARATSSGVQPSSSASRRQRRPTPAECWAVYRSRRSTIATSTGMVPLATSLRRVTARSARSEARRSPRAAVAAISRASAVPIVASSRASTASSRSSRSRSRALMASFIRRERSIRARSSRMAITATPSATTLRGTPGTPAARLTNAIRMVQPIRSAPTIGRRKRRHGSRAGSPSPNATSPLTRRWSTRKKAAAARNAAANHAGSRGVGREAGSRRELEGSDRGGRGQRVCAGARDHHGPAESPVVDRREGRGEQRARPPGSRGRPPRGSAGGSGSRPCGRRRGRPRGAG